MKGKKGNAAERRRYLAELEQRAEKAEHQAEELAAELASLREKSSREIESLRLELKEVKRQRDEAGGPRVEELQALVTKVHLELDKTRHDHLVFEQSSLAVFRKMRRLLMERCGITWPELKALVGELNSGLLKTDPALNALSELATADSPLAREVGAAIGGRAHIMPLGREER